MIYIFNVIPIKYQFPFCRIDKLLLNFIWKCKGLRIAKTILKKSKVGGLTFPGFKTHYQSDINQDSVVLA